MHQQSLFCHVRTEEPLSFTFQSFAGDTWHTPLVHNLQLQLLSFWVVKIPKNYLAVVAVGVFTAGMCEHRHMMSRHFWAEFPRAWGEQPWEKLSLRAQSWQRGKVLDISGNIDMEACLLHGSKGMSRWLTWNVPHQTEGVSDPISETKSDRLDISSRRTKSNYFLPQPLDFSGYFLSAIKLISVMHLRFCLVPMAFPSHSFLHVWRISSSIAVTPLPTGLRIILFWWLMFSWVSGSFSGTQRHSQWRIWWQDFSCWV